MEREANAAMAVDAVGEYERDFRLWLSRRYAAKTVSSYLRDWRRYVSVQGLDGALWGGYGEVLRYVVYLRGSYRRGRTVRYYLSGVKAWHCYVVERGIRSDNPSVSLLIKDMGVSVLRFERLLQQGELQLLVEGREKVRDKVMMGLLVHQALRLEELLSLRVGDIDVHRGLVRIVHSRAYRHRELLLHSSQVGSMMAYIAQERSQNVLASEEGLLVSSGGRGMLGSSVRRIVLGISVRAIGRGVSASLIRQSVLHQKLKCGYDIRVVQAFAGHGKPSVTSRYSESELGELQRGIGSYHPLQ